MLLADEVESGAKASGIASGKHAGVAALGLPSPPISSGSDRSDGDNAVARLGVTISLLPLSKLDVIDTDSVPEDSEFIGSSHLEMKSGSFHLTLVANRRTGSLRPLKEGAHRFKCGGGLLLH